MSSVFDLAKKTSAQEVAQPAAPTEVQQARSVFDLATESTPPDEGPTGQPISQKKGILAGFRGEPRTRLEQILQRQAQNIGIPLASGLLGAPGDVLEIAKKGLGLHEAANVLPTSENISNFIEKLAGKKVEDKSLVEEVASGTAGAFGSVLGLGGPLKAATPLKALGRTLLAAFTPTAAVKAADLADAPDWVKAPIAIGASLLTHRFTGKSLRQINTDLFKQAEGLATGQKVNASGLSREINRIQGLLQKGGSTSAKSGAKGILNEIEQKISNNEIGVDDLMEFKRNISEKVGEFLNIKGSKSIFKLIGKAVDSGIGVFETSSPEFSKVFRQANSLFKGRNEATIIERFIKSHPLLSAEGAAFTKLLLPITGKVAVGVAGLAKATELAGALFRNKGLRQAYFEVFKNASKSEIKATANALSKFNKAANKDEKTRKELGLEG